MPFNPDILPSGTTEGSTKTSGFNPDILPKGFNPDKDPRTTAAQEEPRIANTPEQAGRNVRDMLDPEKPQESKGPHAWEANVPESYRTPRKTKASDLGDRLLGGIESTVNTPIRRAISGIQKNAITGAVFDTMIDPTPSKSFALASWSRGIKSVKDDPVQAGLDFGSTVLESAFALPSVPFAIAGDAAGRFVSIVGRLSGIDEDTNKQNERVARNVGSLQALFSLPEDAIAVGAGLLQHTLGDRLDEVADMIPGSNPNQVALKTLLKYRLSPEQSKQLNSILGGAVIVAGGAMLGAGEGKESPNLGDESVPKDMSTNDAYDLAARGLSENLKSKMLDEYKANKEKLSATKDFDQQIKIATQNASIREAFEKAGYTLDQKNVTIRPTAPGESTSGNSNPFKKFEPEPTQEGKLLGASQEDIDKLDTPDNPKTRSITPKLRLFQKTSDVVRETVEGVLQRSKPTIKYKGETFIAKTGEEHEDLRYQLLDKYPEYKSVYDAIMRDPNETAYLDNEGYTLPDGRYMSYRQLRELPLERDVSTNPKTESVTPEILKEVKEEQTSLGLKSTLPGLPEVSERLGKVATAFHNSMEYLRGKIDKSSTNLDITSSSDAVSNKAKEMGIQLGKEVEVIASQKNPVNTRLASGITIPESKVNQYRMQATSLIHLAGEDESKWNRFKSDIAASPNPKKWMPVLDYAFEHRNDPDLVRAAKKMTDIFNSRVMRENDNGVDVNYAGSYYLPGNYPYEDLFGIKPSIFTPGARGVSSSFSKGKVFTDPVEAIKAGFNPELEANKLIQRRVTAGEWSVQNNMFTDKFSKIAAGVDEPIIKGVGITSKDGKIISNPTPKGYTRIKIGPKDFDIHNEYADLFKAITGNSWVQENLAGRLAIKAEAKVKRGILFIDMMHASRGIILRAIGEASSGRIDAGWNRGTIFDYNDASLHEAVQKGFISQSEADYARANRPIINIARNTGLNANAAARNIYSDFSKPYTEPVMNTFSNWVFNKVYSGTMNEMFVSEWKGRRAKYPELSDEQFGRMLAKELNTAWGQRGKSGFIKSRTAQDISQLFLLAPRWVEGLMTREGGSIKNLVYSMPKDFVGGKGYRPNFLMKAIAGGVAGMYAANQAINFATRGKPTWENEEKGHKLDAFIPNALGGEGEGLWLSPFAPTAEITHDLFRYSQAKGLDNNLGVLAQIVSNKFSPATRAAMVFTTGRDYQGNILKDYDRLKAIGYAMAPIPIMATSALRDRSLGMTGQNIERQLIATGGIKTEPVNPNAPKTSAEEDILSKISDRGFSSTPEDTQTNRLRAQLKSKIGSGKASPQDIQNGIDSGLIMPDSISKESQLEDLATPYFQRLFKRLELGDAKEIYDNMPDEEKKKYSYLLAKKFNNKVAFEKFLFEESKKKNVIELNKGQI